jgi:hypothetical protein
MECDSVIVSAFGKIEKIGAGERGFGCVKSGFDIAGGGVEGDFDVVHDGVDKTNGAVVLLYWTPAAANVRKPWDLSRFNSWRLSDLAVDGRSATEDRRYFRFSNTQ